MIKGATKDERMKTRLLALACLISVPCTVSAAALDTNCSDIIQHSRYLHNNFSMPRYFIKEFYNPTVVRDGLRFWKKKKVVVEQIDPDKLKNYRLTRVNGSFFLGQSPLRLSAEQRKQKKIYVVSGDPLDFGIYVGDPVAHQFHHSSFLGGRPVPAAGTIEFDTTGNTVFISYADNSSGHYKPDDSGVFALLEALYAQDMPMPIEVGFVRTRDDRTGLVETNVLKLQDAVRAWKRGDSYYHPKISRDTLDALRDLIQSLEAQ